MNKGIVMEMTDKSIIVMRQDGKFDRISRRNRSCEIGEEIIYADAGAGVNWRSPSVAGRSAFVAAVVFCLVVFASFAGKMGSSEVVAYVSLDINPSIEMGIDEKEQVLELRGLNEDGSELIQAIDYKGKPMESVTASLLDKAEQKSLAKGEADIVIASSVVNTNAKLNDEQIAEKLRQQVTNHIKTTHPDQVSSYQVEAFAAPQEVREEASKSGVSMGKYSVYLNAKSNGVPITIDDLKKESVHQFVKDHQESKDDIVQPAKMPSKDIFKKLVEEEKSGELDKKLEEKKKERSNKDNSKGNSNSKNDPKKPGSVTTGGPGSTNSNSSNTSKDKKDDNKKDDDKKDDNNKKDDNTKDSGRFPTKPNIPSSGHMTPGGSKPGVTAPGNVRPGSNKDDDLDDDDKKSGGWKDDDIRFDPRKNENKPDIGDKDDDRKNDKPKNDNKPKSNNPGNDGKEDNNKPDNSNKDDGKQDNDKQDNNKQDNNKQDNDKQDNEKQDSKRPDNTKKDDQKKDDNRNKQQDRDSKSSDDRKKDEAVQIEEPKTKAPIQAADTDRLHIFDWFKRS